MLQSLMDWGYVRQKNFATKTEVYLYKTDLIKMGGECVKYFLFDNRFGGIGISVVKDTTCKN